MPGKCQFFFCFFTKLCENLESFPKGSWYFFLWHTFLVYNRILVFNHSVVYMKLLSSHEESEVRKGKDVGYH